MLNRRKFFNLIGKTVLGTIIAINLPDSLAPTIKEELDYNKGAEMIMTLLDVHLNEAMDIFSNIVDEQLYNI